MDKFLNCIGLKIKQYRELHGYTQEDFAGKMDIATSTLSAWENGKSFIKYDSLVKLCRVLEISEADLFCIKPSETGNAFIDKVAQIAAQIPPSKQEQAIKILKTFID